MWAPSTDIWYRVVDIKDDGCRKIGYRALAIKMEG
jgi:hypothetical protein